MLRTALFRSAARVAPLRAAPLRAAPLRLAPLRTPLAAPAVRFMATLPREDIEGRVLAVFRNAVEDSGKVQADSSFNDIGLDSLDVVELMVAVEEEFGIEIPDKESDEIKSIRDAIDYIAAQPEAR